MDRADFTYKITPGTISIFDSERGKLSVANHIEAVLRKIEYWHQGSIFVFKILYRDGTGVRHQVRWDGRCALEKTVGCVKTVTQLRDCDRSLR